MSHRPPPTPRVSRRTATICLALMAAAVSVLCSATTAVAAAQLSWSAPQGLPSAAAPAALSCPSESLCVAVTGQGNVLWTTQPGAQAPAWHSLRVDEGHELTAVSCPSSSFCAAVDSAGMLLSSGDPAGGSWSGPRKIDGAGLTGVSCASPALCAAVDGAGQVLASSAPASGSWPVVASAGAALRAVSCVQTSLCLAVGGSGKALASMAAPSGTWHAATIDGERELTSVSCTASGPCVAVDSSGGIVASSDPGAVPPAGPTWSLTPAAQPGSGGISCADAGFCVAVSGHESSLASDDPTAAVPLWSEARAGGALRTISCIPDGFCGATDTTGRWLSARTPLPQVLTSPPSEVTEAEAVLSGAVDPNDASVSCRFEYGPTTAYGASVPCAAPAPSAGYGPVSARIGGLLPNSVYHYRLVVADESSEQAGTDVAFTTAASAGVLIRPHPSIGGTPAVGQTLTCFSGVAGAGARLTYAWLRDLVAIAGEEGSRYTVKGQDAGHHLQCRVSASGPAGDATATSAFVTIPFGGIPVARGETSVGRPQIHGATVIVPVACSPRAVHGCNVASRLTLVETLSGRRIVAISAQAPRSRASRLRRVTVTLAAARVGLAAGARRGLALVLSHGARRLLAAHGRLPAQLTVTGTIIGVIEATLAQTLIQLGHASHGASAGAPGAKAAQVKPATGRGSSAGPAADGRARSAAAASAFLAATPYMGWDTYLGLGGRFSESTVLEEASQLIRLGLARDGYRYVWLDTGWWRGTRAATGQIEVSAVQWPHGIAWLARTLHRAGLRLGVYTDAGRNGCGGAGQGSYGHYQQDIDTFAAWGIDAVKVDFCGGIEQALEPAAAYGAVHAAIVRNASHHPILLSICNFLQPGQYGGGRPLIGESAFASYSFGPSLGNSWRTDTDVGFPGAVSFAEVLRNMDADAATPQAAGPGHWNDPDYLAPDQGLSATQFRTQLSMWSMLAAPLMISDDLTRIRASSLSAVRNNEVIAIDQDPTGVQATLASAAGPGEVWVKPLAGGSRAVALLNRSSAPRRITTSAAAVGLPPSGAYTVRDVWAHRTRVSSGSLSAYVPGDGTVLLRVSAD